MAPGALIAIFIIVRFVVSSGGFGAGSRTSKHRPWSPPKSAQGSYALWSVVRLMAIIVLLAADGEAFEPAPYGVYRSVRALLLLVLVFPGLLRGALGRAGWVTLTELCATVLPPRGGRREGRATSVFLGSLAALRKGRTSDTLADYYERKLSLVPLPGPIHLAASALVDALRGDQAEARAKLDDVLALDGRADRRGYDVPRARVPSFVRAFAEREVVFHHLAEGNWPALAELPIYARGALPLFAAAAAERVLDRAGAPSDARLVWLWLRASARIATYPLLRRVLATPSRTTEADLAPGFADATDAELVARAMRLARIASERVRVAEANAISNELSRRLHEGDLDVRIEARLAELRGTADPGAAVDELWQIAERSIHDSLVGVPLSYAVATSDALMNAAADRADLAYARLDDQVREYVDCRNDTVGRTYARAVRAYRLLRVEHARIVAADPYARDALFVGPLGRVWNRTAEVGDSEGNWVLAFVVFQFLLREAQELGRADAIRVLSTNRRIFA